MAYTNKERLIERIKGNYCDFKHSLRGVRRETLFNMAGRISAVTEAHDLLTGEYGWEDESEVDFYLMFRDPLTVIADAWESRKNETAIDFDEAVYEPIEDDVTVSQYPLAEGVADDLLYIGEPGDVTIRFAADI